MKPGNIDMKVVKLSAATVRPATETAPPPAPKWIETAGGRVDLVRPVIYLQGSYYDDVVKDHVKILRPDKAYIAHGILVIEETGLWFPLSTIHVGKRNAP